MSGYSYVNFTLRNPQECKISLKQYFTFRLDKQVQGRS